MKLDPRHLVQFAAIVEAGGFSAAAQLHGSSQPALSKMVSDLEKRLGTVLLIQRRNPVIASPLGERLADWGHAIAQALEQAEAAVEGQRTGQNGLLRIGAPSFFCESALPDLILGFQERFPEVNFEITTGYRDELFDLIEARRIDLGFCPIRVEPLTRPITTRELTRLHHTIVCNIDHPIRALPRPDADVLSEAKWIGQKTESMLHNVMAESLEMLGVRQIGTVLRSDSASAIMSFLQNMECLTFLPAFAALDGIEAGNLAIVPVGPLPTILFGVAHHQAIPLSKLAENFVMFSEQMLCISEDRSCAVLLAAETGSVPL